MNIAAFETTDLEASVALLLGERMAETVIGSDKRHEETVLPAMDGLLAKEGVSLSQIDAFAVDAGPGSFTGVRIGVCHANALGFALHKPVIAVDALEALAYPLLHKGRPVCTIIDARNGNGYGALYSDTGEAMLKPQACVIEAFLAAVPAEACFTGTGFPGCDNALPRASAVARLALEKYFSCKAESASPLYLRPSQAERNKKQ